MSVSVKEIKDTERELLKTYKAISEASTDLANARSLAVKAADSSLSTIERGYLQTEANFLVSDFKGIAGIASIDLSTNLEIVASISTIDTAIEFINVERIKLDTGSEECLAQKSEKLVSPHQLDDAAAML